MLRGYQGVVRFHRPMIFCPIDKDKNYFFKNLIYYIYSINYHNIIRRLLWLRLRNEHQKQEKI